MLFHIAVDWSQRMPISSLVPQTHHNTEQNGEDDGLPIILIIKIIKQLSFKTVPIFLRTHGIHKYTYDE